MSAECTECGTDLMAHADNMDFWCPVCAYYKQKEKLAIAVEALEAVDKENKKDAIPPAILSRNKSIRIICETALARIRGKNETDS